MALIDGARTAVNICMGVKRGEVVLILTDTEKENIGEALFQVAKEETKADALIVKMLPGARHGAEPPRPIAEMMRHVDVVIAPTQYSVTHTQARKRANRAGARIATMPGIITKMMSSGGMTADFKEVEKGVKKLAKTLEGSKVIKITTDMGTDFEVRVDGRKWLKDTGICHKKGEFMNLPAGEVFIAPKEGTANGKLIIDGAFWEILENPVTIDVKDGYAKRIGGTKEIAKQISQRGKEGRNIAEVGIGMNPKARIIGNVLEDEKVKGTVHVALGDNSTFGGKVRAGIHIDGIIKEPTLWADDKLIMDDGKLVV
ncbi:MAG: aminopeptidase [Thermoplasmata archaeon]|nr:MAG: aminopeptidase [Thermoplasmata archaeon]